MSAHRAIHTRTLRTYDRFAESVDTRSCVCVCVCVCARACVCVFAEAPENDRWDFEGLSEQEKADTQAAEPTWPGRTAAL